MGFVNVLGRDGGENGLMGRVVNYGAVIMLSLVTVAPGLSHALFVLLSLVGMVARMPFGSGLKRLPIEVWAVVLVFLVSLAVSLLFIVMGGELPRLGWRKLEDLFWLILLVPSWYLFREYLSVKAMALGVAVGALVSGAWAIWEVLNHGVGYRAVGMTGKPIVFGILSMGLATMAFGLSFCFVERRSVQVLMWCVAVLGIMAAILSGSRGAYLFVPILMLVVLYVYRHQFSVLVKWALLLVFLSGSLIAWQSTSLPERIEKGLDEVASYFAEHDPSLSAVGGTSLGVRFEMWRAAASGIAEHPLLGIGLGNMKRFFESKASEGGFNPNVRLYDHAHNEYLNAALSRGVAGLLATVGALLIPLVFFWGRLSQYKCLAVSGIVTVLLFAFSGMSDSVFFFKKDLLLYGLFIVMLSALIRKECRNADSVR